MEFLIRIVRERLQLGAIYGDDEYIHEFVNMRDTDGRTSLVRGAREGHTQVVQCLSAVEETDINMCDKDGISSLHYACKKGDLEMVEVQFFFFSIRIPSRKNPFKIRAGVVRTERNRMTGERL